MFRSGPNPTEPRLDSFESPSRSPNQDSENYAPGPPDSEPGKSVAESAVLSREIREGILSAFIGGTASLSGEAEFKSMLRVDGTFSGRISSDEGMLLVAPSGRVEANVTVAVATIQGTLIGDIVATDRIELGPTANVTGNIIARSLIVQAGAMLDGTCRMSPPYALPEPLTVSEQPAAVEPEPVTEREKPPQVERKQNVLVSKPRRSRVRVASSTAQDDTTAEDKETAAKTMTG